MLRRGGPRVTLQRADGAAPEDVYEHVVEHLPAFLHRVLDTVTASAFSSHHSVTLNVAAEVYT